MQVKIQDDPQYGLVHKTGSIQLEHDLQELHLEKVLLEATYKFVRDMELQGFHLYQAPGLTNPRWVRNPDGQFAAWYAIDWVGERRQSIKDAEGNIVEMPTNRERSLEDSEGMVEYRIVGVFWAPEHKVMRWQSIAERKEREKMDRNPRSVNIEVPFHQPVDQPLILPVKE